MRPQYVLKGWICARGFVTLKMFFFLEKKNRIHGLNLVRDSRAARNGIYLPRGFLLSFNYSGLIVAL